MPAAQTPVEEPRRSPALERRLRQRRADARLRVRLLADIGVLDAHHASSPPRLTGDAYLVEDRRFQALAAQVEALFRGRVYSPALSTSALRVSSSQVGIV